MVAGIEQNDKMVYSAGSAKPWHDLGVELEQDCRFNVDRFFEKSGLDWQVEKIPLVTIERAQKAVNYAMGCSSDDESPSIESDVDHFAIKRKDTNNILGIVGPRYTPVQNSSAVEWFRPWVENEILGFDTAGSLFNGQKIWVLADFAGEQTVEVTKNDDVKKYILFSNSHDGTTSLRVGITLVRVVCNNTLVMAQHHADSKLIRLRHSAQIQQNLDNIRQIVDVANQDFAATIEQFRLLSDRNINQADLRKYVRTLIQGDKDAQKLWDDVPTRTQNIVKGIEARMDSPINEGAANWWKAYNSFNEYLNHEFGRNTSNRLNSLWYGTNEAANRKAFNLALQLAA